MQLNAPKMITWIIALIIGVVGVLVNLGVLSFLSATVGFWLVVLAFLLLLVATVVSGL